MPGPLSGIKVVELSTFVAGPVTARLLGDMGAEVIKVESPTGDSWRISGLGYSERFSLQENPIFDIYNSGKQHISLNLKSPEGKEAFFKLLSEADVFVTNTRPAALKRLGIAYEDLKEKFPRLVYGIVLGYGEEGPDAHKPAFDTTAFWSRSGFLRDLAVKNEMYEPVVAPSGVGDTATAYLLMGEICAALYRRSVTGTGDFVSATLYHTGIFCMGTMVTIAQAPFGRIYPHDRVDSSGISGAYECADGEWLFLAMGNRQVNLPKYYTIIGPPELNDDPRYKVGANIWAHRHTLYGLFREAFLSKTSAEWTQIADEYDLPLIKLSHFSDVSEDPQAWANGFLERVAFPNGHVDIMPTSPIEMASACPPPTQPAPPNGAHTAQILLSLGYTQAQVDAMLESGAAIAAK